MRIFRDINKVELLDTKQGIAIGTFDGLHLGHVEILKKLIKYCNENGLESLVYTFSNHPRAISSVNTTPKRLISLEHKIEVIESLGVDNLVLVEFDHAHRAIEPDVFIEDFLVGKLNAQWIIVGEDFRFGKNASGNVSYLKEHAENRSFEVEIVKHIKHGESKISSTNIRKLLFDGEVAKANLLMGRRFSISGNVIPGRQVGRKLGFPTANIKNCPEMTLIKSGVYLTEIICEGETYLSVTNVGDNPTFEGREYSVETHIIDFDKDIYGKYAVVQFIERIRDEIKFESVDKLILAIGADVEKAKKIYESQY